MKPFMLVALVLALAVPAAAANAPSGTCDGLWFRLLEPNEVPACAELDEWHVCVRAVGHDPAALTFTIKPLPPMQAPPTIAPAPDLGAEILLVTAADEYPLGALFWIHAFGRATSDCSDVHVGFPFAHEGGQ